MIKGLLATDELRALVESGQVDTVLAVFPDLYGRLQGKELDAEFFLEEVATAGTAACAYVLTVDMEMEPTGGYELVSWATGYGDLDVMPDLATLRRASWREQTAMVLCDLQQADGAPVTVAPRSVLRRQVEAARAAGFTVMAGSELEYYVVRSSYAAAAAAGYADLERAGAYVEDYNTLRGSREVEIDDLARRHLRNSGIPVESSKGEAGIGQHELNVRYAEVGQMADRHAIYKLVLKEIAAQQGLSVTFMAKPWDGVNGSSSHLHVSLQREGRNVFAPSGGEAGTETELLRWFLGGWLTHAPELMAFYAPTVNAYKRYQAGSWAPVSLAWGYDNRTVAFRMVGQGKARRIECRLPGADCNPYLAYAATLASGLEGIVRRIEPPFRGTRERIRGRGIGLSEGSGRGGGRSRRERVRTGDAGGGGRTSLRALLRNGGSGVRGGGDGLGAPALLRADLIAPPRRRAGVHLGGSARPTCVASRRKSVSGPPTALSCAPASEAIDGSPP